MRQLALAGICLWLPSTLLADAPGQADQALLTLERIFDAREFRTEGYSAQWLEDGASYVRLEASGETQGGRDIVAYDARTGQSRILAAAAQLTPPGGEAPLEIDGFAFSTDQSLVLIYTNSQRVWRQKTRGDYWVLDRSSRQLKQLGGDAPPSSLMFAKLAPPASGPLTYVKGISSSKTSTRGGSPP